eukprot:9466207-Pyramimonas_sp.AAC.1
MSTGRTRLARPVSPGHPRAVQARDRVLPRGSRGLASQGRLGAGPAPARPQRHGRRVRARALRVVNSAVRGFKGAGRGKGKSAGKCKGEDATAGAAGGPPGGKHGGGRGAAGVAGGFQAHTTGFNCGATGYKSHECWNPANPTSVAAAKAEASG